MLATSSVRGVTRSVRDLLDPPADLPDIVLRWADHDDGVADVWLPPRSLRAGGTGAGARPLLYAVHGGFWSQEHDRSHLRPLAQALCALGWVVVVPEYARAGGRHVAAGVDAPWPLVVDDLRTLRRRVPELLAEVAPGRVRADRPILVGHSAGGQLALWWALDAAAAQVADAPRHVVALAPVADLRAAWAAGLGGGAAEALLGGAPHAGPGDDGDPWAEADTAARLRAGERPYDCPLVLMHGVDDQQVPVQHSTALGADVPAVDVRVLPGVEHFGLIDPLSRAWPALRAALPPA